MAAFTLRLAALTLATCQAPTSERTPADAPAAGRLDVRADDVEAAPPSRWVGVTFQNDRLSVTLTEVGEKPGRGADEPPAPGRRPGTFEVTDLAYDSRRERIYVGTCCEPGSGQIRRIDWGSAPRFTMDDQGFAVDVGGRAPVIARTDTFGTLGVRSDDDDQDVRPDIGVTDVAVGAADRARVVALVDSRRLRALLPTVSVHEPALLTGGFETGCRWPEIRFALPDDATYCRVVPLRNDAVGLLAGTFDPENPVACTGDRLDVYDAGSTELRRGVLTFPSRLRHMSIDESSTFLIFTTVTGAVGWRTLDGRGGALASSGFAAADW